MFRLFKLRPPHGWNAAGWELTIVVVGVLIALFAQQVVENWEWRQNVTGDGNLNVRNGWKADVEANSLDETNSPS